MCVQTFKSLLNLRIPLKDKKQLTEQKFRHEDTALHTFQSIYQIKI